eukprot:gene3055-5988_t
MTAVLFYLVFLFSICVKASDPICDLIAATSISTLSNPLTNWGACNLGLSLIDPCSLPNWQGLTCSGTDVISINFNGINLIKGTIPSSLVKLQKLTEFDIANNQFNGSIPNSIGYLSKIIKFSVYGNSLTGAIPSSLGRLTSVTQLHLYANKLRGTLPTSLSSLSALASLAIDHLQITGTIPSIYGNLATLTYLNIGGNTLLTGTIPSSFSKLSNIVQLRLNSNHLYGSIPWTFSTFSHMTFFTVDNNFLTGTIPNALGLNAKLMDLRLSFNRLTGTIPTSFEFLSNIHRLQLNSNSLSGTIPSAFGRNLTSMSYLGMDSNSFTGTIPPAIALSGNLLSFYVQQNSLSGSSPRSLSAVGFLDISDNLLQDNAMCDMRTAWKGGPSALSYVCGTVANNATALTLTAPSGYIMGAALFASFGTPTGLCPNFTKSSACHAAASTTTVNSYCSGKTTCTLDPAVTTFSTMFGGDPCPSRTRKWLYVKVAIQATNGSASNVWECSEGQYAADTLCTRPWAGVTCSNGFVTAIRLPSLANPLNGTIPSSIGNLHTLTALDLYQNSISGSIPTRLGTLTSLATLTLSGTSMSGTVPYSFRTLKQVSSLGLELFNQHRRPFPAHIAAMSSLSSISLFGHYFTGTVPTALCALSTLTYLDFSQHSRLSCYAACLTSVTTLLTGTVTDHCSSPSGQPTGQPTSNPTLFSPSRTIRPSYKSEHDLLVSAYSRRKCFQWIELYFNVSHTLDLQAAYVWVRPYTAGRDFLSIEGNDYDKSIFTSFSKGLLQMHRASSGTPWSDQIDWIKLINRVMYKMSSDNILPCTAYTDGQFMRTFYFQHRELNSHLGRRTSDHLTITDNTSSIDNTFTKRGELIFTTIMNRFEKEEDCPAKPSLFNPSAVLN